LVCVSDRVGGRLEEQITIVVQIADDRRNAFALIIFVVEGAVFFFSSFRAVFELAYISSLAFTLSPTIAMFVLVPHSTSVIFLVALPIPLDFFFLSQCFWEFL
jgi:hypothetical protein